MPEIDSTLLPDRIFVVARGHLAEAKRLRARLNDLWNTVREDGPFSAWIESPNDQTRELWCCFEPGWDLQREADALMAAFLRAVKAAMDSCCHATAVAVCRSVGIVDPDTHRMPLLAQENEFDTLPAKGQLPGLRPDQFQTLRLFQPFASRADEVIARALHHLVAGLEAAEGGMTLFTAWASAARPVPHLPSGATLKHISVEPAGTLTAPKRLARFELDGLEPGATFAGNPDVSFDPVINAEPWPTNPDDNFSARSHRLVTITRHLIEGLERSVNLPFRVDPLEALDKQFPAEPTPTWLPVQFHETSERQRVREAIKESAPGLATYLSSDGTLTYLRFAANGTVVGREIPPASKLPGCGTDGTAVEEATRAAAGRWGLPDFVLRPKVFHKGSGIRELGDGTILTGQRGISLQVKARPVTTDTPDKAARWIMKNAAHGLRQARGTIRSTLQNPSVQLTNLRDRDVTVLGGAVEWVPLVVIDHPDPPREVFPAKDPKGRSVVMLRRDWEFLWDQLRSATAIVDYVHRVAGEDEPLELGAETHRYFDLASRDAAAPASELPAWLPETGASRISAPLLPRDPAASADQLGHAIFHRILEDIANTDFTGDEADRLRLLSHIDRVAVATRADLGRTLLRRLVACARALPDGHRMEHRILLIDHGELQLTFTTMSQLTNIHREIYKTWLLHRRQTFLRSSEAQGPVYPWTVGVLLTPLAGGHRPWDTTVIATNGPPAYDDEEYDRLRPLLAPNA